MKSLKFIAVAGFAAAALAHSASAQTTVYVTGSSAFRTAAIAAINAATGKSAPDGSDTGATSGPKNTSFIWNNATVNGVTGVTVKATFTGSAAGIGTVAGSLAIPFLPDNSTGTTNHAAFDDATGSTPHATYPTAVPDFCLSDAYQSSTTFVGGSNVDLNDNIVGVVAFKWIASKGFPLNGGTAPVSKNSVEPNFIGGLFSAGRAPLSFMTGNAADHNVIIFAVGRNPDSGTRITALSDSGYGALKLVKQYQAVPELTAANGSVTSHQLYPIETIAGLSTIAAGNSGQASGGTLANYMSATLATSGLSGMNGSVTYSAAYYLTYLGLGDASAALTNNAVELAYKGVNYSATALREGTYTFWGYEHIMDRGDIDGTSAGDLRDAMISSITSAGTDLSAVGFHDDANMHVKRTQDGGRLQIKGFVF